MIRAHFQYGEGTFRLDAAFEVPSRGITGIFGPSGAGKSTLLRCIAGLARAAQGHFHIDGTCWQDSGGNIFLPPHKRALGYVPQVPALFAHLDVRRNIEYGLRRTPTEQRTIEPEQVIAWLGIEALLGRMPATLSGGERQRVAIARALLASPRLLLLDEPVSALDEAARAEILPCLARLHRELTIPMFLVTHTLGELARFADMIVHIEQGRVAGSGPLVEMLPRLGTPADALAVLEGCVVEIDAAHHLMAVQTAFGAIWAHRTAGIGATVRLQIAAREVSLARQADLESSILNQLPVAIQAIATAGPAQLLISLSPVGQRAPALLALVTTKSREHLGLRVGEELVARVKGVNVSAY